jgi:hypothetical protein
MHNGVEIEAYEQIGDRVAAANVGSAEPKTPMVLHRVERRKISRVGQLVDDQNVMLGLTDQMTDQRRSDETGPTGNRNPHR